MQFVCDLAYSVSDQAALLGVYPALTKGKDMTLLTTKGNLRTEIIQLIRDSDAKDSFVDLAEVALDSLMDDTVIKDIPVIGTIMGITRTVLTIPDRIFIKKLAKFYESLNDIPKKDIEEFLSVIEKEDSVQNVGEKLLVLVDRLDNLEKATLIGEAFRYFVLKKIDKQAFEMLCHSISMIYLGHLQNLLEAKRNPLGSAHKDFWLALVSCGLATMMVQMPETVDDLEPGMTGVAYKITAIGDVLVEILNERAKRLSTASI